MQRCDRAGADFAPRKSGTTEKLSSSSLFPAELRQEKGTFFVSRFAHHMRSRTKTNYDFLGERNEYHDEKCKQIYPTVFSGEPSADAVGDQELSGLAADLAQRGFAGRQSGIDYPDESGRKVGIFQGFSRYWL